MNSDTESTVPPGLPRAGDHQATEDDLLLQRVRAALTPMPAVNQRAIAAILAAAAERRPTRIARWRRRLVTLIEQFRYATASPVRIVAVASLCVAAGFVGGGWLHRDTDTRTGRRNAGAVATGARASSAGQNVAAQPVTDTANPSVALVAVQFVLDARHAANAKTVSVVGDFNEWNVTAAPMTRDRGVWSVSLPTAQGRHVYAFVLDGERWIVDPRAPRATDSDYGRPGSVIIVQAP